MLQEEKTAKGSKRFYHRLDDYFAKMSDNEVIQDINSHPSLHAWSRRVLGSVSASTSQWGHHATIYHYLKHSRPGIIEQLQATAADIAKLWPSNHVELSALFSRADWWSNAVKRRFREEVRDRLLNLNSAGWWETIAPYALPLIDAHLDGGLRAAYQIEPLVWMELHLPSRINYVNKSNRSSWIHHDLKKLIRKKISARKKERMAAIKAEKQQSANPVSKKKGAVAES